ncbi:MAG TPA: anhydro-N-acetylmuramic acid kinase [Terriglobia bacterium]|nr:anhydro-N-acetylmuramic acid kinase [Terriglobia bacterium]
MRLNNTSNRATPTGAKSRLAVGLMSGTSVDGIDAALVQISGLAEIPRVRLRSFLTTGYPPDVRNRVMHAASGEPLTAQEVSQLNFLLGELFAEAVLGVCRRGRVSPKRLSIIGSHGQTIYHQGRPTQESGWNIASTLQIGEPAVIAARVGRPVVADFRSADIAAGGQGAPLVPMVDYLLMKHPRKGTVALNIGGIANITVVPPGARPGEVFGFDTGPGNMVMDSLVRHFTGGRESYDPGGRRASRGSVIEGILREALVFPFFAQSPPRSAGREQFGKVFIEQYFLSWPRLRFEDALRTALELTVKTIAVALIRFVFPRFQMHRLVVSGGGVHNRLLTRRLRELLPQLSFHRSDQFGLPVDAKEAMAFAVLADRTLQGLPGNLPSVTGARRAVVLGKITQP